ncbi:MAG: hypothetical protein AAGE52_04600 [Myxococcota bacterium]
MARATPLLILCALAGCSELGEYATSDEEIYAGAVIGTDEPDCVAGEVCSFIRRGFPEGVELELELDPRLAATEPGHLTTTGEVCGTTFDNVELRPIPALFHDHLSQLDFPGEARLRNYIFALRPTTGPLAGRDAMAFVSLLRGGSVDVRIVAGSGESDCSTDTDCARYDAGECDFFGVFHLRRRDR